MLAALLFVRLLVLLVIWDIDFKLRILISHKATVRYMNYKLAQHAQHLFRAARPLVGIRLAQEESLVGELPERMLIVSNHQSVIDIPALLAAFPNHSLRFVAKRELRRGFPAVSQMLRTQRHALINRSGEFAVAMRQLEQLARQADGNICPAIFPEGTRSRDGALRPFHSGAVRRILTGQRLPICAVAIEGGWQFSRLSDLSRLPWGHQYKLRIVGLFTEIETKSEINRSLQQAHAAIAAQLQRWRGATNA